MASINIILDTRRTNSKGNYPAKITISNNQTDSAISLNIDLPKKAWIKNGLERPVKTSHPGAKIINDQIQSLYIELRKKISDLELSGWTKNAKASDIKKRILNDRSAVKPAEVFFTDYANTFAEACKSAGTKNNYLYTIKKLQAYAGKDCLAFEEVTHQFLRKFDDHLSGAGSGVNTRSIHFRNIRAVFNRAIDDEVISQELYPFRKFKIKNADKEKVSLTAEQVKILYNYEFETIRKPENGNKLKRGQTKNIPVSALTMARDFWMLSFFMCGINPVDLYHLKKPENGRISFVRAKIQHETNTPVRLLIQPEAQEIIDRYANDDESGYLLKFIDKYLSYDIFKSFLGKKIREIAEITGFKGLTMYWARYSWATIADSIDIQEKIISKGLGHVDKSMAGKKYIAFDWTKVDKANRQVIDFVMKK